MFVLTVINNMQQSIENQNIAVIGVENQRNKNESRSVKRKLGRRHAYTVKRASRLNEVTLSFVP